MAVVRTRSVFVLILAAVGLLCLGCEPRVLVVGDSITALSKRKIIATWKGSGYDPSFLAIGEVGACANVQGPEPWIERIQSKLSRGEIEEVVVELGTNDVQTGQDDCINDYANKGMAPIVDVLPNVPIFWLTVREDIDPPRSATLNAKLREAAARWPNLGILDYDGHFRPHCSDWCDGVHLNAAGQQEYATWLASALDDVTCSQFQYQEQAQIFASRHPGAAKLGVDRDGIACKGLPHQPPDCSIAPPFSQSDMPAVVRSGTWQLRRSYTTAGDLCFSFGDAGDVPLTGDWDGNRTKTPGVFRNGTWYLRNSDTTGGVDIVVHFGNPDDVPVVGDWNHDGTDTPGVFRRGTWYLTNFSDRGIAEDVVPFGNPDDVPVVGDWNHDGTDTPGVFRRGTWYLTSFSDRGIAEDVFNFGQASDIPRTWR
ncbi:MAG: hypothetical protein E6G06_17035 [Actinobacteria bacterium]|nr:MAG: hypothetical protein E6G06_17035 [Actinomycetota bacterium]